ncbi:MAG: HEAT repeat domain-containing protein [Methanothrix sp.]
MDDKWIDYYQILGIKFSSSEVEIKKAFREKSFLYHSDFLQDQEEFIRNHAEDEMRKLLEAYHVLTDKNKKEKYDLEWNSKKLKTERASYRSNESKEKNNSYNSDRAWSGSSQSQRKEQNYSQSSEKASYGFNESNETYNFRYNKINVEALIENLRSEDWRIRVNAINILVDSRHIDSIGDIIDLLWDPHFQVRSNAAIALGKFGDPCAIQPLASKLIGQKPLRDYDENERREIGGLWSWGRVRMDGCPPDLDSRVRTSVVEALGMIQDLTAVDLLIDVMFYDRDQVVADKAMKSLESLGYSKFDIIGFWIKEGKRHASQNNYEKAIWFLDGAIRIDSSDVEAWTDKGRMLINMRKYIEAIECFDTSLKLDPNYSYAWNAKGFALAKIGNYNEAISCSDKSIRLDPNNPTFRNNRKEILELEKDASSKLTINIGGFRLRWD